MSLSVNDCVILKITSPGATGRVVHIKNIDVTWECWDMWHEGYGLRRPYEDDVVYHVVLDKPDHVHGAMVVSVHPDDLEFDVLGWFRKKMV